MLFTSNGGILDLDWLFSAHNIEANSGFPFYNIKSTSQTEFVIEFALAGFDIADVEVTVEDDKLLIKSIRNKLSEESGAFLHQGFSFRRFSRGFALKPEVKVKGAKMSNGVLQVFLEKVIPEKHVTKINIEAPSADLYPQLLNENSSI